MQAITIHDLAVHRGAKGTDGCFSGQDYADVGLAIIGGCAWCEATVAAYNAYPTKAGFWACGECIGRRGVEGWDDCAEANADIFEDEDDS